MRYLILGSGPAGIAAAKAARKLDKDAEVILATEEHAAPYLRPLLPDFVSGERELSGVADPQGKDLADLGIRFSGGERARRGAGSGRCDPTRPSSTAPATSASRRRGRCASSATRWSGSIRACPGSGTPSPARSRCGSPTGSGPAA